MNLTHDNRKILLLLKDIFEPGGMTNNFTATEGSASPLQHLTPGETGAYAFVRQSPDPTTYTSKYWVFLRVPESFVFLVTWSLFGVVLIPVFYFFYFT